MQQGYITDIAYLSGYFPELSVPRLSLCLLAAGQAHAVPATPAYLELGYGQGLALAVHAAAMPGLHVGTDFNAAHAANAQQLVAGLGGDICILEDSFEQLAARADLPMFDVIVLHGIWSWVPEASRRAIIDIAARRLRPGGILYLSYNAVPGWSAGLPLRHLLKQFAEQEATGTRLQRVDKSMAFAEQLAAGDARYFQANPHIRQRLGELRGYDSHYLAHEFFNEHWQPMAFSEVAEALAAAKLGFAASATLIENISTLYLPEAWQAQLAGLGSDVLRETVRDYMVNQGFRRDIHVKGVRALNQAELDHQRAAFPFLRVGRSPDPPQEVRTPLGPAELRQEIYGPVVAAILACGDERITLAQLAEDRTLAFLPHAGIWEALLVLVATGWLAPCPPVPPDADVLARARSFNRARAARALLQAEDSTLAAPAIGAGVAVNRIELLLLHAHFSGEPDAARFVLAILRREGRNLLVDDKPVEDEAEQLTLVRDIEVRFSGELMPLLRRLQAV